MMRSLHIEARSSNASARTGKQAQVTTVKEAAAAEAEEADKVDDAAVNKDSSKPATSKPK